MEPLIAILLREILVEIEGDAEEELAACGSGHHNCLKATAEALLKLRDVNACCDTLNTLCEAAHTTMAASPTRAAPFCWRRMYTEASLLRSLALIHASYSEDASSAQSQLLDAIAQLDMSIIVAGAAGPGRLDMVLDILRLAQDRYEALSPPAIPPTHHRFPSSATPVTPVHSAHKNVPVLPTAPSMAHFKRLLDSPFILRRFASHWPAVQDSTWSDFSYLRKVSGPGRVVPVEVGHDYRTDSWTQTIMPWQEFLGFLEKGSCSEVLYMAQHNLFTQFPALRGDIEVYDYCYSAPEAPSTYINYRPPTNDEELIINTWLGPAGTISPAHTDPYFNLYTQVAGRKTVWLCPPSLTPSIHASGNTSDVDVFSTPAESRSDHLDFWQDVPREAMWAALRPGDVLFFPPGWWHAMRSEDVSLSVSMWF